MKYNSLVRLAVESKKNSHAPYSNFHVGAALLTSGGKVYTGCNVESSSYGLTMCAERTAVFKAYSEGERSFTAIAIAGDTEDYLPPCGACRQVLSDLCGDIDVVLINKEGGAAVHKLSSLLPLAFGIKDLKGKE